MEYQSSSYRYEKEIRVIDKLLYSELTKYFMDEGKNIVEFNFLAQHLSLVRDQGDTGACSYVHTVVCTEMLYRILHRPIKHRGVPNLPGKFYFDVVDCFDQLYHELSHLANATAKLHSTMGRQGTRIPNVLSYIQKIGLLANSACTNPQERNLAAEFIKTPHRNRLDWYEKVESGEVIPLLRKFPIIAVMHFYQSFKISPIVYTGPTENENLDQRDFKDSHAVLLVGSFRTRTENDENQYVIAQNSYGTGYSFNGYVTMKFDTPHLLTEFWLPILSPEMDYLKKRKQSPQLVGSKRKGLDSAI